MPKRASIEFLPCTDPESAALLPSSTRQAHMANSFGNAVDPSRSGNRSSINRGAPRPVLLLVLLAALLLPLPAHAKRKPAPKVDPVEYQGIRYTPHGTGTRQCVRATDISTGKILWDRTVFRTFLIPLLEEDVQWVFIKRMFVSDNKLIVIAENKHAYSLNLRTGAVARLRKPPPEP